VVDRDNLGKFSAAQNQIWQEASNLAHELYNSNEATGGRDQFGPGNKFIAPTVAGGKVFVGTTNTLAIFGLLK
jgi:hypothetical protein